MTLYNPENPDSDNNYEHPSIIKSCNQDLIPLVLSHRVDQSTVPPIKKLVFLTKICYDSLYGI